MILRDKDNQPTEYTNQRNRFVAIDFETLNECRSSVCSVGVVVVEDNKVVKRFHSYVKPSTMYENYWCVKTHGIRYKDVCKSPDFKTVWEEVDKLIDGCPLVAHNAAFERSCINACNEEFGTNGDYLYLDTVALSKQYISGLPNYKLDTVCESIKHNLRNHHNALEDALACAKILIKINKKEKLQ